MALIVMKFGGTSVANVERIKNVARQAIAKKKAGNDVVLVASAMAGVTDKLIGYLNELTPDHNLREYDQMVSTGETSNVPLIAQAIISAGEAAESFTGVQAGIQTNNSHSKARVVRIDTANLKRALGEGKICVVAGFQGYDPASGNITTLGRGGSDTTAVALAAALKADKCEIYTDVDGVYTADPRIVKDAKKLDVISHEEMLELASLGAKVLVSRCVELGMTHDIDIMVLSSLEDKQGTLVTSKLGGRNMENLVISGITSDKNQAKIVVSGLPDKVGTASKLFTELADANINIDVIVQNATRNELSDISFTVQKNELVRAKNVCDVAANRVGAKVHADENIAKVSIVGVGITSNVGVAATMFRVLAEHAINIQMISTSDIKISCVIDEKFAEVAVRSLHDAFITGK
ncbi:aspartate kinase [Deferribacterales bacterium RsTz2092]|nr:aspartokinase [Deferribacterales bacterium]